MRQQVVDNDLSNAPDLEGDARMDTDGQAGMGTDGLGNMEDDYDDYDSDDDADHQATAGLGITQQIVAASEGLPVAQTGEASAPPGESGERFKPF